MIKTKQKLNSAAEDDFERNRNVGTEWEDDKKKDAEAEIRNFYENKRDKNETAENKMVEL